MRRLHKFIQDLHFKHSYNIMTKENVLKMELEINYWIGENYPMVESYSYVKIDVDAYSIDLKVLIDPKFISELEIHYPERLI